MSFRSRNGHEGKETGLQCAWRERFRFLLTHEGCREKLQPCLCLRFSDDVAGPLVGELLGWF